MNNILYIYIYIFFFFVLKIDTSIHKTNIFTLAKSLTSQNDFDSNKLLNIFRQDVLCMI